MPLERLHACVCVTECDASVVFVYLLTDVPHTPVSTEHHANKELNEA